MPFVSSSPLEVLGLLLSSGFHGNYAGFIHRKSRTSWKTHGLWRRHGPGALFLGQVQPGEVFVVDGGGGLALQHADQGAAAAEEEAQQQSRTAPDDHDPGDAEQQMRRLGDVVLLRLGNVGEVGGEVYEADELVALIGDGIAADRVTSGPLRRISSEA